MLNGTAISVCECVCVCAYGCEIASRPLHTHFPHDTCTHTRRKRSVQQLVWLTLPHQPKRDPGSIFAALQSSEQFFLHLSSFCFHTNLAQLPGLKPQLSELMQEWARHSFPSEAGFTHMRADFFFFCYCYLTFHNCLDGEDQITYHMVSHFWDCRDDQICATKASESLVSG